jgi:hypothetical protein
MNIADKEKQIFPKVQRSHEHFQQSIQMFEDYLDDSNPSTPGDYYRARKLLKEGEIAYHEAIKNAKKLLGPMPEYATEEYKHWREEFLTKYRVLATCSELSECEAELSADEIISQIMPPEEIQALLQLHYQSQQEGNRKLENIKVRIVLDKLHQMLTHASELQKQALLKHQNSL